MQAPFRSVSLVAHAYEQELRADAARTRLVSRAETRQDGVAGLDRFRRTVVVGLARVCQRFGIIGQPRRRPLTRPARLD